MYITYHEEVSVEGVDTAKVPHNVLHKDIQEYLKSKGVDQVYYQVRTGNYYFFIFLMNGDRVDVKL